MRAASPRNASWSLVDELAAIDDDMLLEKARELLAKARAEPQLHLSTIQTASQEKAQSSENADSKVLPPFLPSTDRDEQRQATATPTQDAQSEIAPLKGSNGSTDQHIRPLLEDKTSKGDDLPAVPPSEDVVGAQPMQSPAGQPVTLPPVPTEVVHPTTSMDLPVRSHVPSFAREDIDTEEDNEDIVVAKVPFQFGSAPAEATPQPAAHATQAEPTPTTSARHTQPADNNQLQGEDSYVEKEEIQSPAKLPVKATEPHADSEPSSPSSATMFRPSLFKSNLFKTIDK